MSRVLIDVGNSSIKWCQINPSSNIAVAQTHRCDRSPDALAKDFAAQAVTASEFWLSSVADDGFNDAIAGVCHGYPSGAAARVELAASAVTEQGLRNSYETPARMGADRWLAMLAAWVREQRAVVVVDAGTAITIDLIDASGQHEGGYILPGIQTMERSLLQQTDRVRYDASNKIAISPGHSTAACVSAGIWSAALGAVQTVLRRYPDHHLVVTGGDGQHLLSLGLNGEWRPSLVLEGLALRAQNPPA